MPMIGIDKIQTTPCLISEVKSKIVTGKGKRIKQQK